MEGTIKLFRDIIFAIPIAIVMWALIIYTASVVLGADLPTKVTGAWCHEELKISVGPTFMEGRQIRCDVARWVEPIQKSPGDPVFVFMVCKGKQDQTIKFKQAQVWVADHERLVISSVKDGSHIRTYNKCSNGTGPLTTAQKIIPHIPHQYYVPIKPSPPRRTDWQQEGGATEEFGQVFVPVKRLPEHFIGRWSLEKECPKGTVRVVHSNYIETDDGSRCALFNMQALRGTSFVRLTMYCKAVEKEFTVKETWGINRYSQMMVMDRETEKLTAYHRCSGGGGSQTYDPTAPDASIPDPRQPHFEAQKNGLRVLDVRIVPGTKWRASVTKDGETYVSCQVTRNSNSAEIRFAIGSEGSLVILLRDEFQEKAVSETLGWSKGQSYRTVLFIDKWDPIYTQAKRIWEHTLLIPISNIDPNIIFEAKRISIAIGGISMRGYDVEGLSVARQDLYDCYETHSGK